METETPSFANEQLDSSVGGVAGGVAAAGGSTSNDNRGKHRILAELKRLEQELKSLEEELEELERTENVSSICAELLLFLMLHDRCIPITEQMAQ
ncbi:guanine nucleotide-binding protein subunit gamma 1 isoform X5 [Ziziphus jujuba]|uniref:Guanine nucleotide-binding protein subunit gamma 1 isoform X5 n=1 Tax=Ziziphus jujuba TaxID=326968 RepID=A0ABM3IXB2_ZIZJJ|nr:guanine nucleotide-binding protein subunit gamma 1 isoform X5 [Ziziphus jujuba]